MTFARLLSALTLAAAAALAPAADTVQVQAKRTPSTATWTSYATRLVSLLSGFTPSTESYDGYGGWNAASATAKGRFYCEKIDGRWWMVDPNGHLFLQKGLAGVSMGTSATEKSAFAGIFGSTASWVSKTTALLKSRSFNTIGAWSDDANLRTASAPLPYSKFLGMMAAFGKSIGGTYSQPGHTGYPNNCIFVFDSRFPGFCDSFCASNVAKFKSDPYMVGYFTDNELPFFHTSLDNFLKQPASDPGHIAAQDWLNARLGHGGATIAEATSADRDAFLGFVIDKYFSITSAAIRKYDPNHMVMGSRFYTDDKNSPAAFAAAGKWCDLISINFYGAWNPSQSQATNWEKWSGKPFIITEFYTKGMDSGLPNTSGAGWCVPTQSDRGKFYQNFCLSLLQSKCSVGWQLFLYQDNDPNQAGTEASNTDSNKGIVTIRYAEYTAFTGLIQGLNSQAYNLTRWFDGTTPPPPTTTNQAPTVSFVSPANGSTFTAPGSFTVTTNAADSDGTIAKVDYYLDGALIHTEQVAPYEFPWSGIAAGGHALKATATDNDGATASASVSFTVVASNAAPTVSITAPAAGANVGVAPADVHITANAADSDGSIAKVEFRLDGMLIHTENASPYDFVQNDVQAGAHSLVARAYDNAGATKDSAAVSFTVGAPASGTGLAARYYSNQDFSGTTVSRVDQTVDFDWGTGSPDPAIGDDTFSARWSGQISVPAAGTWTISTVSDDGVRLWLDGVLRIDNWTLHAATTNQVAIALAAGKHSIRIDYFENGGDAVMKLQWAGPNVAKQTVPRSALYPDALTASVFEVGASAALPTFEDPIDGGDAGADPGTTDSSGPQSRCGLGGGIAIALALMLARRRERR
jgi:hypothetical protein